MKNVVLIGMPGVGKSTLGVLLAKALGYRFLDTDLVIQAQEGRLLREIIDQEGIDGFLAIEGRACAQLQADRSVIATGGSAIYEPEAMAHLKTLGPVVYLKLGRNALAKRLGSLKKRGVVLRPGQTFKDLYQERAPLYQQYADITVDCGGQDIPHALALTLQRLREAEK